MIRPHRAHPLWFAFIVHRLSGLVLALFLPAHFYVLALALREAQALDGFLVLTEHPLAKAMETALVLLLALHIFGGLRVMALELLNWSHAQKTIAAATTAASFAIAGLFFLRAI